MTRRHLRSTVPLDQESTTPHTRTRSSRGNASLSAQSSSRQQAVDTNPRSRPSKGKRKQPPDDSQSLESSMRATTGSGILTVGTSEPRPNNPASSNPVTDTNPRSRSRKGKRKQPLDGSQLPESSKRAAIGSGVLAVGTSEPPSIDLTSSTPRPKCFRISGLPLSWTEDDLFDALHEIDPSLTRQDYRPSLYPACCNSTQTALLNVEPCTELLQRRNHLQVSESARRTAAILTIDSQFYNLTPLNVPVGEVVADVIAVTGLAGHAFGSWRNRETHQMWLKDLLPYDVKNIRIMTYGYDSRLDGHEGSAEIRLLDFQRHFIEQLQNARNSIPNNRPIIFIGHSLGGILILQALIESKRNPSLRHILDAIYSICFFGTPHEGMRTSDLEEMVDVVSGDYETSWHNLLRQLSEGSEYLENQKEELCYIWKEYKPKIVSFYETAPTPTVRRSESGSYGRDGKVSEMVKRFSAQLYIPTEQRIPVAKNHTNMVKFASAEDETYQTVARYLTEWVKSITESYAAAIKIQNHQKSQEYIDCRKSLKPSDYQSYREELWLRRHENTCTWILDDQRYRLWAEKDGQAILWISGDPGCGKSILSSFLTKDITRGITNQACMTYFFCDDKDERLRSAHSILVNLLAQLLDHVPDINTHFLTEPEYATNKENTSWSFGMLWRVFERIINDAHRGQVYILIDALDECEEKSRIMLLNKLKHLLRDPTTTTQLMKIIITSRPHIPVTSYLTDVIELPLAAKNLENDITAFVSASVHKQPQFAGNLGDEVRQALIRGANGMFLWVSLILDDLKNSTNTTPRAIRERLQMLPPDLSGVYTNILRKIRTEDQKTATSILQWVVWAVRPLHLQELAIAIAIRPGRHTSMPSMEDDMHTDLRQVLRLIFGPMLRIEDGDTVHLVHQSAKDFLSGMNSSTEGGLSLPVLVTSPVESNMQLAESCLAYLSFDECEVGPVAVQHSWMHDVRTNIGILKHKLPFLIYAAAYWPEHVRQVDTSDQHQTLCTAFRKLAESRRKIDLAYQVFMLSWSHYVSFIVTEPLQIASSLGLIAFAEEFLDHGANINAAGGRYGNALQGAAAEGHEAVFRLLSTRADIHITEVIVMEIAKNARNGKEIMEVLFSTHPNIEMTEPIVTAAASNRESGKEVMEQLLSAHPDIEITEPIVIAAAGNYRAKEVMEVLLTARPDIEITEPIVTAAAGNDSGKEVMEVLLSARPDIEITEPIVTAAAGNRYHGKKVMEVLLSARPDIEITEPILTAAAGNPFHGEKVMEVLLSTRPDIMITEPIVTAAAGNLYRGEKVMEVLLSARPDIEITEPILIAAAGNPFHGEKVMEVLLSTRPDIMITEPIVTAAAGNLYRGEKVMEVLLSARPDIEITEPIVIAAAGNDGSKEVMEVLLSARPDIMITEPIVIAIAGNHRGKDLMEVLLSARPDIEITEPIVIAAAGNSFHGKEVMEVLLSARPDIEITEPIVTAAAGNLYRGKEVMKALLSSRPNIEITEPVVTAAAGNRRNGKEVMRLLLDSDRQFGVHPASVQAVAYFGMLNHTKYLVTECSKITLNEQYTHLLHAAVESGDIDILKIFLELGGNCMSPDEHNWTANVTSSQSRNALALQKFAEMAHPPSSPVFPPAKWVSEQTCVSIQLQGGGVGLLYSGTLASTKCSVKGDHPFPPGNLGTNYFEVTVVESSSQLNMGVGICGEHILQNNVPYRYCFASVYFSRGKCLQGTKPYYDTVDCGPKYSSGDVVGCGIDWKSESYFFTLNGQKHKTIQNDELLRRRLYPLVSFNGKFNVRIQANFRGPFKYTLPQDEESCGDLKQLK
ncbi:hypothetical protein BDD12DRAFT_909826 [Trichophaea hybrida]|nr:hypothetical protein BDD12DRAFT_909826 [Trichophaea hybrida]